MSLCGRRAVETTYGRWQRAATSVPSSNRLGCLPADAPRTLFAGELFSHGSLPARGYGKAIRRLPRRSHLLAGATLSPMPATSRLGELPKIYGANAPQLHHILKKYGANAPQLRAIFLKLESSTANLFRDTLPVSPSPQPRAPRPAGTLPYACSSPARQSSHAPPAIHSLHFTPTNHQSCVHPRRTS